MNAASFGAALDEAGRDLRHASEETVRVHFVSAYRRVVGLAPVDTGLHRGAVTPFAGGGAGGGADTVWEAGRTYPSPGDGLARTIAAGFKLGDRIGFEDRATTRKRFKYGIMIQTPAQRILFGFPAGTRPAVSPKAPEGDYGKVLQEEMGTLDRDHEKAVRLAWEGK